MEGDNENNAPWGTRRDRVRNPFLTYLCMLLMLTIIFDSAPEEADHPRLRNKRPLTEEEKRMKEESLHRASLTNYQNDSLTHLNEYLLGFEKESAINEKDESVAVGRIPKNLTGIFTGTWKRINVETPMSIIPINTVTMLQKNSEEEENNTVANSDRILSTSFGKNNLGVFSSVELNPKLFPPKADFPLKKNSGNLKFQLEDMPTYARGLHQVGGTFDFMDGDTPRNLVDILSTVHGFYMSSTGEVSMVTNAGFHGKRVAVEFPKAPESNEDKTGTKQTIHLQDTLVNENEEDRFLNENEDTIEATKENVAENELENNLESVRIHDDEYHGLRQVDDATLQRLVDKGLKKSYDKTSSRRLGEDVMVNPASAFISEENDAVWDSEGLLKKHGITFRDDMAKHFRAGGSNNVCFFRFDLTASTKGTEASSTSEHRMNNAQRINITGHATSVNCNVTLAIDLYGLQVDIARVMDKAWSFSTIVTLTCFTQIVVLVLQNQYADTQTGAAKTSLGTVCFFAILDAFMCLGYLTSGVVVESLFNEFVAVAFFKLLLFSLFEIRLLFTVYKARYPDAFNQGETARRRELERLYVRFYLALLICLVFAWQFRRYTRTLVFLSCSFYIPQILTNIHRDTGDPFHDKFLFGMAATRLFVPLYVFGCPYNLINLLVEEGTSPLSYDPGFCLVLIMWVGAQVGVLYMQKVHGPRYHIPKSMLPAKYDYGRTIPMQLRGTDCVICMLPVSDVGNNEHMITPCNHLFHESCLDPWLQIKQECPTCRARLPAA